MPLRALPTLLLLCSALASETCDYTFATYVEKRPVDLPKRFTLEIDVGSCQVVHNKALVVDECEVSVLFGRDEASGTVAMGLFASAAKLQDSTYVEEVSVNISDVQASVDVFEGCASSVVEQVTTVFEAERVFQVYGWANYPPPSRPPPASPPPSRPPPASPPPDDHRWWKTLIVLASAGSMLLLLCVVFHRRRRS